VGLRTVERGKIEAGSLARTKTGIRNTASTAIECEEQAEI
jgi:hypothetical protein